MFGISSILMDEVIGFVGKEITTDTKEKVLEVGKETIKAVVESKESGVSIDNNFIIEALEMFVKSTGNTLDDKALCMIKAYLKSDC